MPSIPDPLGLEVEEITARFKVVLEALEAPASPRLLSPEQISQLLSDLMQAGQCMRAITTGSNEELSRAVCACRGQIERLRGLLPFIHSALLRERARLTQERERLNSIAAWAQASNQSL